MDWVRSLAYITGTVDQELLLRNDIWGQSKNFKKLHRKLKTVK